MITGSRYRITLVFMMIAVAILSVTFWNAYIDINSDMFATENIKNDKFGVSELFPTANKGETWFFNSSHPIDGQFDPNKANITRNSDGSWHVEPGITRMLAFTKSAGDLSDAIRSNLSTYNYSQLSQIGYWYKPSDWKNVEITGYAKVIYANPPFDSLVWYARGGKHDSLVPCEGTSLKGRLSVNGIASWIKEIWHTGGYTNERGRVQATDSIIGRWIGWKIVMYNVDNDKAVKMESYLDDKDNNRWIKVTDLIDKGGWYSNYPDSVFYSANCGKPKDYIITNGGAIATFRSDNMVWDFKDLSVREIQPPT